MKMAFYKKALGTDLLAIVISLSIHGGLALILSVYTPFVWPQKVHKEPVFVDVVDLPPAPQEKTEEPEKITRFSHRSQKVEKEKTVPWVVRGTEDKDDGVKEALLVKPKKLIPPEEPKALKGPDKAVEEPPPATSESEKKAPETIETDEVVTEILTASPERSLTERSRTQEKVPDTVMDRAVIDQEGPEAIPPTEEPAKPPGTVPKLFPTDERLMELAKKYYEEEPEKEKGKVLSLNTSELRYTKYLLNLKRRIEFFWDYPPSSVRKGEQGKLRINFTIKSDGSVEVLDVVNSSNYPALDDAAVTAIRLAAPFNPFPEDFGTEKIDIRGSFEYSIILFGDRSVHDRPGRGR
jgi:protein TonB